MDFVKNILSKFFGSNEGKDVGWIIIGKIAKMALSLIVSVFTTRYLGHYTYGLINYAASYAVKRLLNIPK